MHYYVLYILVVHMCAMRENCMNKYISGLTTYVIRQVLRLGTENVKQNLCTSISVRYMLTILNL